LYSSPNIIKVIKSRKMRWVRHIAHMQEMRNMYRIVVRKLKKRHHLEDLGLGGRIILKWSLQKQDVREWNKFYWPRKSPMVGFVNMIMNLQVTTNNDNSTKLKIHQS